jgi:DNA-directed RNA polymerase specialized sigma24 family protein
MNDTHSIQDNLFLLTGESSPSAPLLRIVALVEIERTNLMYALARSSLGNQLTDQNAVQVWDYASLDARVILPLAREWPELEQRIWQRYYGERWSITAIAAAEALSEATVYTVLERTRTQLLQRLAEDPNDQPDC